MVRVKVIYLMGALLLTVSIASAVGAQSQRSAAPAAASAAVAAAAQTGRAETAANSSSTQAPELEHRNPRYKIQRDDVVSITFPLSPEFDQPRVTVQPDGFIDLQEVGSIYVQDLTVPELVQAIKKAYAGILHEPIIDVDLVDFQRPYFLVSGQVGKPGQYDLRHDTTVSEAIAIAGGLSPGAKTQIFVLHRVSPDWMQVKKLNVKDVFNGKNPQEDAYLAPGDQVFVPEKFITKFRKYVPYGIGTSVGTGFY
jgi:polysaccharide biosynthesis/export protein